MGRKKLKDMTPEDFDAERERQRAEFEERMAEDRRIMKMHADRQRQYTFVMPECCAKMIETATICLNTPEEFTSGDTKTLPKWYIRTGEREGLGSGQRHGYTEPQFCPFCATPVPEVERRVTDRKIMVVTDGGYYCATCGERCHSCSCLPAAFHWQPKGSTRIIPEIPKNEDDEDEEDL